MHTHTHTIARNTQSAFILRDAPFRNPAQEDDGPGARSATVGCCSQTTVGACERAQLGCVRSCARPLRLSCVYARITSETIGFRDREGFLFFFHCLLHYLTVLSIAPLPQIPNHVLPCCFAARDRSALHWAAYAGRKSVRLCTGIGSEWRTVK